MLAAFIPDSPGELVALVFCLCLFAVLLGLGALVARDSIRGKGRWGVNLKGLAGTECPLCGEPMPVVRVPRSFSQALWGGWTCGECGCETDKWGKEIPAEVEPADDPSSERPARRRRRPTSE